MFRSTIFAGKCVFCCLFVILFLSNKIYSQETKIPSRAENTIWDSVRFGGSLGLNFGNGNFTGIISPSAIYDFNPILSTGIGLTGAYASQSRFNATSFGGSVITLIRPLRFLQLSAEFEELYITRNYKLDGSTLKEQDWVPALWAGLGFTTGNLITGIRYNLLHDANKSFYSSAFMPFVSVYF
tara:strand:+ start:32 stop:580 length:549 start_codon:yes stop_codon:yes gene_type:complete